MVVNPLSDAEMCEKRGLRAKAKQFVNAHRIVNLCMLPKASSLLILLDGTIKYCLKSTSDVIVNNPGITIHGLATIATINIANVLNCN